MAERFSFCRAVRLANPKSITVADVRAALQAALLWLRLRLWLSLLFGWTLSLCVQVDYMIGELVTELKQVQLYEDTTVIFWTCALTCAWLRCAATCLTRVLMRVVQRPWVQAG